MTAMNSLKRILIQTISLFILLQSTSACSNGQMELKERYFLIAENKENAVLYRITIRAKTIRSDAKYQSGWYPSSALDAVFGDIAGSSEVAALTTQKAITEKISQTLKSLYDQYSAALLAGKTENELKTLQQRIYQARMLPDPNGAPLKNSRVIEYNPTASILTFREGTKQVIFLSADPDQVIGAIDNFAKSTESSAAINQLVETIVAKNNQAMITIKIEREVSEADELILFNQLNESASKFAETKTPTFKEAEILLQILYSITGAQL